MRFSQAQIPGSPPPSSVEPRQKWHSLFRTCSALLEQMASVEHANQDSQLQRVRGLEDGQRLLVPSAGANVSSEREMVRTGNTNSCAVCSAEVSLAIIDCYRVACVDRFGVPTRVFGPPIIRLEYSRPT